MDGTGATPDISSGSVALSINLGVLKAVENLDQVVAAQLAASIGLGTTVDAYA